MSNCIKDCEKDGILMLFCVAEVRNQQTYPYVSFIGQTLANHSHVDLSLVGIDGSNSDSVLCHSDLRTCCTSTQGIHHGDWYIPNGDRLQHGITDLTRVLVSRRVTPLHNR